MCSSIRVCSWNFIGSMPGRCSPAKLLRREVRLALQMNECQFDCETVRDFLSQEHKVTALGASSDDGFQTYIRVKSRVRVEEQYKALFEELIDLE